MFCRYTTAALSNEIIECLFAVMEMRGDGKEDENKKEINIIILMLFFMPL
jgi:hypothetical protein